MLNREDKSERVEGWINVRVFQSWGSKIFTRMMGFALEGCRDSDALGLVNINYAQPRYMNLGGHESDVKDKTSESAVAKS